MATINDSPEAAAAESAHIAPTLESDAPVSGGAPASSFKAYAILGIVVTICVIAVLALQFTEFSFYKADPSVWLAK